MNVERPFDPIETPARSSSPWHAMSSAQVAARLRTTDAGLMAKDAAARLVRDGLNELAPPPTPSVLLLFLRQFNSPLIHLLIAAAVVSLGLGHHGDAGFIGVVLIVNALIGTFQEGKAAGSLAALRRMVGRTATVQREGVISVVNVRDIVVGNIVEVESGMAVPADIRLSGVTDPDSLREQLSVGITSRSQPLASHALTIGQGAASILLSLAVMLYITFFLLRDGRSLAHSIGASVPLRETHRQSTAPFNPQQENLA